MKKEDYFSEDCLVKNNLYNSVEKVITCPKCKKIYKNPLMCSSCSATFCEKCIDNKSKCGVCSQNNIEFKEDISKKQILSRLTYKCKNCLEEVLQKNISSHLELNCEHKNKKEPVKTLKEIYTTKKELKRLSNKQIEKKMKKKEIIFVLKSKLFLIELILILYI